LPFLLISTKLTKETDAEEIRLDFGECFLTP